MAIIDQLRVSALSENDVKYNINCFVCMKIDFLFFV